MGIATTTNLVEVHYERSRNVCMASAIALVNGVSAIALVTGVSAVFVGFLLLGTWLRHGGASGTSHFRRIQILGHAAVGILGVVLVVVQLAADRDPRWRWTAVVVLFTASALGATMFLPWWWPQGAVRGQRPCRLLPRRGPLPHAQGADAWRSR
jgi:hypothetical protein